MHVVSSGQTVTISQGVASGYLVLASGTLDLQGAVTTQTTIDAGGIFSVTSGGMARATSLAGYETIGAKSLAAHNTIHSNGELEVLSGGQARDTTIKGGVEYVDAGATVGETDFRLGSGSVLTRVAAALFADLPHLPAFDTPFWHVV